MCLYVCRAKPRRSSSILRFDIYFKQELLSGKSLCSTYFAITLIDGERTKGRSALFGLLMFPYCSYWHAVQYSIEPLLKSFFGDLPVHNQKLYLNPNLQITALTQEIVKLGGILMLLRLHTNYMGEQRVMFRVGCNHNAHIVQYHVILSGGFMVTDNLVTDNFVTNF